MVSRRTEKFFSKVEDCKASPRCRARCGVVHRHRCAIRAPLRDGDEIAMRSRYDGSSADDVDRTVKYISDQVKAPLDGVLAFLRERACSWRCSCVK